MLKDKDYIEYIAQGCPAMIHIDAPAFLLKTALTMSMWIVNTVKKLNNTLRYYKNSFGLMEPSKSSGDFENIETSLLRNFQ